MNFNYFLKKLDKKEIYMWKPSINFWIMLCCSLMIWLLLGPIWWRHVDDFGPIQFFINKEWSFLDSYKLLDGFGSYPPIWSFWTGFSFIFKIFGLTQTRYVSLILGFISNSISAYLTLCISLNLIFNTLKINQIKIYKFIYFVEVLSIAFNLFNPEIMLHSITYMPYNLSTITTLFLLLLLIPLNNEYVDGNLYLSRKILKISFSRIILFVYISIFLSFQSIILALGFGTTIFLSRKLNFISFLNIRFLIKKIKISYFFCKNFFQTENYFLKIFNLFLIYLPISYIYKLFIIYKRSYKPGEWANGVDNIFNLTFSEYPFFEWILKVLNNTISILGQAIYPFRFYQDKAALLISILIVISLTLIGIYRQSSKVFLINIISVFSITIFLSSIGNFIYSPTRHTIFLYPYVWIIIILMFFEIYKITLKINFSFSNFFLILSLLILLFNTIGLINSHNLIQYKRNERIKLENMAKNSKFFIDDMYLLEHVSQYPTHGSKEYDVTRNKICSLEKIKGEKEITFFVFNHRYRLDISNEIHLEDLINRSYGCINKQDSIMVIDKFEKENLYDIEQNNNIYNGGSSIFSYVIKVKKNK